MKNFSDAHAKSSPPAQFYTIRIADLLDADWADWFDGMSVTSRDDENQTILAGYVRDQAQLLGILNKLRSLNLTLLSVQGRDSETKEQ